MLNNTILDEISNAKAKMLKKNKSYSKQVEEFDNFIKENNCKLKVE